MKLSFNPATKEFVVSECGTIISTHPDGDSAIAAMGIALEPELPAIAYDDSDDGGSFEDLLEPLK